MNFLQKNAHTTALYALVFGATMLLLAAGFIFLPGTVPQLNTAYASADQEINQLEDERYRYFFSKNIDTFFQGEGIAGMMERLQRALADGQITMFVCHSLSHEVGHYGGYPDNYTDIENFTTKENLDFCGSGFMHGVEAQLANNTYPENIEDLYEFCKLSMTYEPYYNGCYHGAGHSFMENTRNYKDAIKECNVLKTDEVITVHDCYRGVFSENANIMSNSGSSADDLLSFCSALDIDLQHSCAEEVNGFELPIDASQQEVTQALRKCLDHTYSEIIKEGCIKSVAGVAADRTLGQDKDLVASEAVFDFPHHLVHQYINSTHATFMKTASVDSSLSFASFCEAFVGTEYFDFCNSFSKSQ